MDFEKSSIERLKRALYSRNENIVPKEKRTPVHGQQPTIPTDWGETHTFDVYTDSMSKKPSTFFGTFLKFSFVFFVICLLIASYIFFGGTNTISSNNVDIAIVAPSSVSSGEELDLGLTVSNKNRTDLENVALYIDYPLGSQVVNTADRILSHEKIDLGTINQGSTKDYSVRTLLFGAKDAVKTFTFRLEYSVKGSNAVFSKEKTFDISIGSSPLILNTSAPEEITSGDMVTFTTDVTSNSAVTVKNTLVKIDYPYGFTYKSSNIPPIKGTTTWSIGDLKNGDKKTITISGTLIGQNLEDRSFRVSAGTGVLSTDQTFDTDLAVSISTIGIRKSFFNLTATSGSGEPAHFGNLVPVVISLENTLPDKITHVQIEATIDGNVLDQSQVSPANGGYYRSNVNKILWDKNGTDSLSQILPGDSVQLSFSLASLPNSVTTRMIKNPHMTAHIVVTGNREGATPGIVSSSADIDIRIASVATLDAKSYKNTGPLSNTGPVPPKVDKESTYTITWTLTNTTNDLKNAMLSATLPTGIEWKNMTSPTGEKITYNPDTRVVSWNIGDIFAGTGFMYSAKEASFMVGLTPSANQVGSAPTLLSDTAFTADDGYASTTVSASAPSVTTAFSDFSYKPGTDRVVK